MLQNMREKSGSFIIWILFAIIIAAFVLFFGPQTDQGGLGCGTSRAVALEVDDEDVSMHSYRFSFNGIGLLANIPGNQRRTLALDLLLEREILAQEAEALGFRVTDEVIDKALASGEFYIAGRRVDGKEVYFEKDEAAGTSFFSLEYLERLTQGSLGLPNIAELKEQQRREMLADFVRSELVGGATVSEEEARKNFVLSNTRVHADYVRFETGRYRSGVRLSAEDVEEYAREHAEELKEEWESAKARWAQEKPRLRGRVIRVAKAPAPPESDPAVPPPGEDAAGETDTEAEGGAAEKEAAESGAPSPEGDSNAADSEVAPADSTRPVIEKALADIREGKGFADVAREVSEDRSASLGGAIGWRSADSLGYGKAVVEAVKELEVGEVSDVIEGPRDYFLFLVEERSEKALTYDQMRLQLARQKAPEYFGRLLARQAAEEALAKAEDTPLSELFEKAPPQSPSFRPEDLEKLPPELREQMLRQMMQQQPGTGTLYTEGRNRYVQLGDAEKAAPADAEDKKATGTADRKGEAAAGEAASADKSANAAGAAANAEGASPADAEDLPAVQVASPNLQQLRGVTRNGDYITGVGRSQELVDALFSSLSDGELADQVFEVREPEGFVVIQLTSREEADLEKFAEQAEQIRETMTTAKGQEVYASWLSGRCEALKKAEKIGHNQELLLVEEGKVLPYEPCATLGN